MSFTLASEPSGSTTLTLPTVDGTIAVSAQDPLSLNPTTGDLSLTLGSGLTVSGSALAVDFGSITTVGALSSGSIASGFGPIDIGTSPLSAGQVTLGGSVPLVFQGGSGSVSLSLSSDPTGTNTITLPDASGTLAVAVASPLNLNAGTGEVSLQLDPSSILRVDEVGRLTANTSEITTVGTLTSGSIASGFGDIDIGSSSLTAGEGTFDSVQFDFPSSPDTCAFTLGTQTCAIASSDASMLDISISADYDTSSLDINTPSGLPSVDVSCGEAGYGQLITVIVNSSGADFPVKLPHCFENGNSECTMMSGTAISLVCLEGDVLYRLS